jgi:transcriptional regulator GlxA family with amidase domain
LDAPLARQSGWSVAELAKLCGVCVRTMERHFLATRGQKPKAWLVGQRQKQAMELLRDGSAIKETAAALGYDHANHFSREFNATWGFSPRTARLRFNAKTPK